MSSFEEYILHEPDPKKPKRIIGLKVVKINKVMQK